MSDLSLASRVRATLHYFDLFDHPLTLLEVRRYLYSPHLADGGKPAGEAAMEARPQLSDIQVALIAVGAAENDGFWFLPGRAEIVSVREHRFRISSAKFRRARRVAAIMRLLPSVRLVAVCNSLALANASELSDIDLFVVAKPGTLWATRLLVVGALAVLGLRPTDTDTADKVCMSFFVSESRLNLRDIALQPEDTYLHYWIASLLPLYDAGGVMDAFLGANAWVGERVPGALEPRRNSDALALPRWLAALTSVATPFLRLLDPIASAVQRRAFPVDLSKAAAGLGNDVVVRDDILKFHVTDRRALFQERFRTAFARSSALARVADSGVFGTSGGLSPQGSAPRAHATTSQKQQ